MRRQTHFILLLLFLTGQAFAATKTIFGYIEKAVIVDKNMVLPAKLDTGAKSSSLHAVNIKRVRKHGKSYVRFTVPYQGKDIPFLSEYVGSVSIKARTQEVQHIMRPVVMMKVRLGQKEQVIRVNLTNRANFIYPLLLGRQAIVAFGGLVDPSTKYEAPIQLESQ